MDMSFTMKAYKDTLASVSEVLGICLIVSFLYALTFLIHLFYLVSFLQVLLRKFRLSINQTLLNWDKIRNINNWDKIKHSKVFY